MDALDVKTFADLRAAGATRKQIAGAVRSGVLVRARRDRYVRGDAPEVFVQAVRVGGRLTCSSLLALHGVWIHTNSSTHVHIKAGASRLRGLGARGRGVDPTDNLRSLGPRLHWKGLVRPEDATEGCVSLVDALIHAVVCETPRNAVATLDSALNKRLISDADVAEIFAALPRRFRALMPLIDPRAESGTETLMRLLLRGLGCAVDLQVRLPGLGRVDLIVDGWLIVECDSREHHSSPQQQREDRRRDLAAARLGYLTLRVTAADVLYDYEAVLDALQSILGAHGACAPVTPGHAPVS